MTLVADVEMPRGLTLDETGRAYVSADNKIFRIDEHGLERIAGGDRGFSGDDGPALVAELDGPEQMAFSPSGELFFADSGNNVIRRIRHDGRIETVAGVHGMSICCVSDDEPATEAILDTPTGIAFDEEGSLFVAERDGNRIRKIDASTGLIRTIAGSNQSLPGYNGDGILANLALVSSPRRIAVASDGSVYFSDMDNERVRKITPEGFIHTVAGSGLPFYYGDGFDARAAGLAWPTGLAFDEDGRLLIADMINWHIRLVDRSGVITSVAGAPLPYLIYENDYRLRGECRRGGVGGPPEQVQLCYPHDIVSTSGGSFLIADFGNDRILRVSR